MFEGGLRPGSGMLAAVCAPSLSLKRLACGWYGVGHTNRRQPGEMRGTVVGREGRFKGTRDAREEVVSRA
jgi:hypothetical protein